MVLLVEKGMKPGPRGFKGALRSPMMWEVEHGWGCKRSGMPPRIGPSRPCHTTRAEGWCGGAGGHFSKFSVRFFVRIRRYAMLERRA